MSHAPRAPRKLIRPSRRSVVLAILVAAAPLLSALWLAEAQSTCAAPPAGMVAWYPGDGSASDIQGGNNGTLHNGATFDPGAGITRPTGSGAVQQRGVGLALALQPDGKILIGGDFTTFNGVARGSVARLSADGSLDTSFNPGSGANGEVNDLALQPDGKIVIGGNFTQYNGVARERIARANPDGSLDTSFDPGTGANAQVNTITLMSGGRILIGGFFTQVNGASRNRIARLNVNGSLDASFDPGSGFNDIVLTTTLQPDGKILIGGVFTQYNGVPRFAAARLLGDSACPAPVSVQFSSATFSVTEGCVPATLTVTLTGAPSGPVSVDYTVTEGTAKQKTDFTYVAGTVLPSASSSAQAAGRFISGQLEFAPGETEKEITVLITEDGFAEGTEHLTATLSNPRGATLGGVAAATLNINDNETVNSATNPIDDAGTYVCQLYHDFLHRQPDPAGHAFWTEGITRCGPDQACVSGKRHDVAAAFFLSIEFQQTGYFVYRAYEAGLDRRPTYEEFMRDLNGVGLGVEVGIGDWQQRLAGQRRAFAEWMAQTDAFKATFPDGMAAGAFADKLFQNADVAPTGTEREAVVSAYGVGDAQGRAAALVAAIESGSAYNRLYNPGFVLIEYFGFMRRDPEDPPDSDLSGYNFWLQKMDTFTLPGEDARLESDAFGRIKRAEMVRAFIVSTEYRGRFGQP